MEFPKVTVIIPQWAEAERFINNLEQYRKIDYPDFEVFVVSDREVELPAGPFHLILTGKKRTGPAEKRDAALREAHGEILAFIDDDAYPHPDWIKNAVRHFSNPQIAGVGGPGVTPSEDSISARAGGAVYESFFGSGPLRYRFRPLGKVRDVDDYPAYNLFFRKEFLINVGGWGTTFYGGEDTKVCLEIVKAGGRIVYDPDVVVYHHRRPLFSEHLRQVANVGRHRGYFVKKYAETSRRLIYFIPSILSAGYILFFALSFIYSSVRTIFLFCTIMLLVLFFLSAPSKNPLVRGMASLGILFHHLTYGIYFLKGLFTRELKR